MKLPSLFNGNGMVGRGAYEAPEFADLRAFVAHLDALGIDRSLVWHVEARDLHPLRGNRRLLEEIAREGLQERLLPALVVTPACYFEDGVMPFLREQLAQGTVRALRMTPEVSRFPLREIERLLGTLAEFKPAVFWDARGFGEDRNLRDLELLAARFPGVSFVVAQKMWGGFGEVLDLLWRCPNTYVDISWLHMRGTIELLVHHFGPERVLFGIGPRAHHGAAIAALVHAKITEDQREGIAHGNLERLLRLPPLADPLARPPEHVRSKHLWNTLLSGQPIRDVEIVDGHGHTPPHTRGWIVEQNGFEAGIAETLDLMDRLGVDQLIVSTEPALFGENLAGNLEGERLLAPQGKRFAGYLVFNPLYAGEMEPEFDRFFSRSFYVGFKLLPSYWRRPVTDAGYAPVWTYADRHRLPVLIHTWEDSCNAPAMLREIVARHPGAFFLLGHSGGGDTGRLQAEELAIEFPNVFLEFCGSFTARRPFETSLQRVGRDRVIYGSDAVAHNMAWELGRYLSMPLPDEELVPGLAANLRRILTQRV